MSPGRVHDPQDHAAIRTSQHDIAERARDATPGGRDSRFLDVVAEQPYCRISTVVDRCDVSRQTASTWLHALVGAGLLTDLRSAATSSSSTVICCRSPPGIAPRARPAVLLNQRPLNVLRNRDDT